MLNYKLFKGRKMNSCDATVVSTGRRCGCRVNGSGNLCGRHGGLSQSITRRLNLGLTVNICSATVSSTGLRCRCESEYGRDRCRRHRGRTMSRFDSLLQDLEDLDIEKEEVEMDYISKFYCCICMEDVDSENAGCQMNCCKKGFCIGCINKWVETSTSCPHCRAEIK